MTGPLIDFYPRRGDTGWSCLACRPPLTVDMAGLDIAQSPRWHIEPTTELAEAAADAHLRDVHGVTLARRTVS